MDDGGRNAPRNAARIFSRDFCLLFVSSFATTGIYYLTMTLIARYAIAMYQCSDAAAGLAASVFMVGGVLGRIVCGWIPRTRLRFWSIASMGLMLLACLAYQVAHFSYALLIVIRLAHGLGFGVAGTLVPALAVQKLPWERMGEGTGYFMLSVTLGTAIGPLAGMIVRQGFDYSALFAFCAAIIAVGLITVLLVPDAADRAASVEPVSPIRISLKSVFDANTWKFSLFMLILGISYMPINAFLESYSLELGLHEFAPFVFLVYATTLLVTRPAAGRLMDRRGANSVLYPSIISMAAALALCACARNAPMLLVVGVLMAFGFGTSMSIAQAQVTKMSDSDGVSRAIATMFLFTDLGSAIGPALMGIVATALGFSAMYTACVGVALLALAYYHFVSSRQAAQR